jgi:hypothetical protein
MIQILREKNPKMIQILREFFLNINLDILYYVNLHFINADWRLSYGSEEKRDCKKIKRDYPGALACGKRVGASDGGSFSGENSR